MSEKQPARDAAIELFKRKYPLVTREASYARQILDGFNEGFDEGEAFGRADGIEEFVRHALEVPLDHRTADYLRFVQAEMLKEAKGNVSK